MTDFLASRPKCISSNTFANKNRVMVHRHGYYTIIDFNEVDIRIYLPEKVIISLLRVDKSLCLLKLKSITVLLYDFSFKNENFATFTFIVKDMFNLQSKTSKEFLTSFSKRLLKYFNIVFCIHMYINSLNGEHKMLS